MGKEPRKRETGAHDHRAGDDKKGSHGKRMPQRVEDVESFFV
jgi:hypothetical protein